MWEAKRAGVVLSDKRDVKSDYKKRQRGSLHTSKEVSSSGECKCKRLCTQHGSTYNIKQLLTDLKEIGDNTIIAGGSNMLLSTKCRSPRRKISKETGFKDTSAQVNLTDTC